MISDAETSQEMEQIIFRSTFESRPNALCHLTFSWNKKDLDLDRRQGRGVNDHDNCKPTFVKMTYVSVQRLEEGNHGKNTSHTL